MSEDSLRRIGKQNEAIISLLGRMAFTEEKVRAIVVSRKQNPDKYVEGYNSCDGSHTVTQISEIVEVSQPNMTNILSQWEELGIVYEIDKPGGKFYKRIFPIRALRE